MQWELSSRIPGHLVRKGTSSNSPCGGSLDWLLGGKEPNIELKLGQDTLMDRVVHCSPNLQLSLIKCLPLLCLCEEIIHTWLQILQSLQRCIVKFFHKAIAVR